jgi:hypothetical protein
MKLEDFTLIPGLLLFATKHATDTKPKSKLTQIFNINENNCFINNALN